MSEEIEGKVCEVVKGLIRGAMANQEYVDRLLQGVKVWNQWRQNNRRIKPDLSNAKFACANFSNADLYQANLSSANLNQVNLNQANLSGADLSSSDLSSGQLGKANLSSANLSGANLSYADLDGADLSGADLSGADLSHVDLRDADLNDADLNGAIFSYAFFRNADLRNVNLSNANLSGTNLSGTNLSGTNLSGADLSSTDLSGADLNGTNLSGADLSGAILRGADLSGAILRGANLSGVDLKGVDLKGASLEGVNLSAAILQDTDLSAANLRGTNLSGANLERACLKGAYLSGAYLFSANFSGADLEGAYFGAAQALGTNFNAATLTGACIEDWNINARTDLREVICDYMFTGYDYERRQFTNRIPHDSTKFFAPGDFTKLVQQSLNTVNLIFREGLDWRSFAYSFQQLQVQYADQQIAIQNIENKGDGTVVVKLAVAPDADKGNIEQSFWRGFEMAQKTIAGQYEARLEDKDKHINQLFTLLQQSQERLGEVPKLMAENPKYDLRGSKFGGGFAAEGGTQTGGTFNDFSQNIEQNINEIGGLIQALRSQAETFPEGVRQETLDHIADLETDIGQPPEKRKPSRIKATLLALAGMATLVSGMVAGANEFATNVQELSEKLGIPLATEQVQPQAQQSDAIDVKAIKADQP